MDKAFAVLGSQGYVGRWFIHNLKGHGAAPDVLTDKWLHYRDIAFIPDTKESQATQQGEEEPPKLTIVGTDGKH